jgi:hypothetical protein
MLLLFRTIRKTPFVTRKKTNCRDRKLKTCDLRQNRPERNHDVRNSDPKTFDNDHFFDALTNIKQSTLISELILIGLGRRGPYGNAGYCEEIVAAGQCVPESTDPGVPHGSGEQCLLMVSV